MRHKKTLDKRVSKLDVVLPTNTLEQWWPTAKAKMQMAEATGEHFVW